MTGAQVIQVIVLVAKLVGQPPDLMVEVARAESRLQPAAICDHSLSTADSDDWADMIEGGAGGGLFCFQWDTAKWAAERAGLDIEPEDLSDPYLNAYLAAKLLEWGYGGYFHAIALLPENKRPSADDPIFRNAPMWAIN